jgi:hypothetical protein
VVERLPKRRGQCEDRPRDGPHQESDGRRDGRLRPPFTCPPVARAGPAHHSATCGSDRVTTVRVPGPLPSQGNFARMRRIHVSTYPGDDQS